LNKIIKQNLLININILKREKNVLRKTTIASNKSEENLLFSPKILNRYMGHHNKLVRQKTKFLTYPAKYLQTLLLVVTESNALKSYVWFD